MIGKICQLVRLYWYMWDFVITELSQRSKAKKVHLVCICQSRHTALDAENVLVASIYIEPATLDRVGD